MTKLTADLAAQMTEHLAAGEFVLVAAVIEHEHVTKVSAGILGQGAVSSIIGPSASQLRGTARLLPSEGRVIWVLTNQRMMVFGCKLGAVLGDLLNAIPIVEVAGIEARKGKITLGKLDLSFTDGSTIRFDLHADSEADLINQAAVAAIPVSAGTPGRKAENWSRLAVEREAAARKRGRQR